ncbi:MAG: thiamine pyrophosphate-binding protein [SAR202 cluster bacterium]|nr:thiamine pyrophosphate-binding protein [Chloroflexota bacterium]MQG51512.1 thiamine pyrophosphate-binding protein [SAR202 cluster bacterium]
MSKMSGGEALVNSLVREGVEVIFGLPGVQMYGVVSAIKENPAIKMIVPRHEQATTYMADGYARASRGIGVAMVVPGPGLYNAAAGLSTAYSVSSQVLMIAGQIPRATIGKNLGGLHEVNDQLETIKPVTKFQKRIMNLKDIPDSMAEVFSELRNGHPRPVEVEMPPETMVEKDEVELYEPAPQLRVAASDESIETAAKLIIDAKNPIIYAGTGVVRSQAEEELIQLTESTNIPVINSAGSKGVISDDHKHSLGSSLSGKGPIKDLVESSDLIIVLGSRFALRNPAGDGCQIIHLDIDPEETKILEGRIQKSVTSVNGDAKLSIQKLTDKIKSMGGTSLNSPGEMVAKIREQVTSGDQITEPQNSILDSLRAGMPKETITVWDMTQMGYYSRAFWKTYYTSTYIDSGYSGNLGYAYPTALGAKVAKPDVPVVSISGDGGFMYNVQELSTAVKYGINTVAVVFNDNHYGNVRRDLEEDWTGDYGTEFVNPNFVQMAESFGALGIKVTDPNKVGDAIAEAIAAERPALIDVDMIDTAKLPRPFVGKAAWAIPHEDLLP